MSVDKGQQDWFRYNKGAKFDPGREELVWPSRSNIMAKRVVR